MKERIHKAAVFGLSVLLLPYVVAVRIFRPDHFHAKIDEYDRARIAAAIPEVEGKTLDEIRAHFEAMGFDVEFVIPPAPDRQRDMAESARWN